MDNLETTARNGTVWKVLCVDDERSILRSLRRVLSQHDYDVALANSGAEALEMVQSDNFDLIISDMRMPAMSGAELLATLARDCPDMIRILLTGFSDIESTIRAVNEGRIHRYVQKPWNSEQLLNVLNEELETKRLRSENKALLEIVQQQNTQLQNSNQQLQELNERLEEKVRVRTEQIRQAMQNLENRNRQIQEQARATIRVFYNLLALSGLKSSCHAREVSLLCQLFAQSLALNDSETRQIQLAGLLSEVGVLCLPSELVSTPRHAMSEAQQTEFLHHPQLAFKAMSPVAHLSSIARTIRYQFEHFNGEGQPAGLAGTAIPLGARILALARDYIFLIRGITHKTRYSSRTATDILRKAAGHIYDPELVERLPKLIPKLEADLLGRDERVISTTALEPGMQLTRDVVGDNDLLLLSEGHRLTDETIARLRSYEEHEPEPLEIFVLARR